MPSATYTVEPCPVHDACFNVVPGPGYHRFLGAHYRTRVTAQSRADALNAECVLTPESYAIVFGTTHCACTDAACPTWQAGFEAGKDFEWMTTQVTP